MLYGMAVMTALRKCAMNSMAKIGRGSLMANTPLRSFRISDEVYNAAKVQAEADGVSVTEVIVQMLKTYGGK